MQEMEEMWVGFLGGEDPLEEGRATHSGILAGKIPWKEELPWWLSNKESTRQAGDASFIPGSGRSPGGGHGNPHQYPCLGNPTDREAWWATVHRFTKELDTA